MQHYSDILIERRQIWNSKKILKKLYHRWYRKIETALTPGSILEIGSGSGNLKEFFPQVISSDILLTPWADVVLDAHRLPFHDETFDNIVMFDVLHHLNDPALFFHGAQKALKPKGRIILMEPYVSWVSFPVYRFFHHEGMDWYVDPFKKVPEGKDTNYLHGNQAIPTLMFETYRHHFAKNFPDLKIVRKERMDFMIYPLSGGFHNPSLCPLFLWEVLKYIENLLNPLNRFLAFRLFVVLEKT